MSDIHTNLVTASHHLLEVQSKSILLVEDTAAHALLIQRSLDKLGWDVTHVSRGSAALDCLRKEPQKIILLDLSLPDYDGIELITEILNLNKNAPIIVVTSQEDVKKSVSAMQAGAWDYVIKADQSSFHNNLCNAIDSCWKKRLFKAEHKLASECRVAELIKSERIEAVEEALSLLCSEVNNPLSGLLMYSDILSKRVEELHNKEILQHVVESAQKVALALEKIKNFNKIKLSER